jgi:hypothetical protein
LRPSIRTLLPAVLLTLATSCSSSASKDDDDDDTLEGEETGPDSDGDGSPDADDCAPDNPDVHPGADEECNGRDDDCDGTTDEDPVNGNTYYADLDGDGYYGDSETVVACNLPSGFGFEPTDCDDADASVHPSQDEGCDLIDTDCDGELGEDELDLDGDGFAACLECDDNDAAVSPDADELCNGIDDDCDGTTDEEGVWFVDDDGDGFGDDGAGVLIAGCDGTPEGRAAAPGDCDDTDPGVNPDATEVCDDGDVDEDCDGLSDDDDDSVSTSRGEYYYPDADEDGYGEEDASRVRRCDPASGWADVEGDCDDSEPLANPGLDEVCGDGIDNDCDGGAGGCGPYGSAYLRESSWSASSTVSARLVPDADGDGLADVLIGNRSAVYVVPGRAASGSVSSREYAQLNCGSTGGCGDHVEAPGDLNGDGHVDYFVAAGTADRSYRDEGEIYLVLGPVSGHHTLSTVAEAIWKGGAVARYLGSADMAHVGDQNGDGEPDMMVSQLRSGAPGAMLLASDEPTGERTLNGPRFTSRGSNNSMRIDGVDDVNGDGVTDVLFGCRNDDSSGASVGAAFVVFGPTTSGMSLGSADIVLLGGSGASGAGLDVADAGDQDGDGLSDLLISDVQDQVHVVLGPTTGTHTLAAMSFVLDDPGGDSINGMSAGDLNDDGTPDLALAADNQLSIVLGPVTAALDLGTADGRFSHSGDFESPHIGGDATGDGIDDLLFFTESSTDYATLIAGGLGL